MVKVVTISSLSAIGSKKVPRVVCCRQVRAMYPSRTSLMQVSKNTMSAAMRAS